MDLPLETSLTSPYLQKLHEAIFSSGDGSVSHGVILPIRMSQD